MSIQIAMDAAIKSLRAHTTAIDTTTHNIANMNNDAYSRQIANITATEPFTPAGSVGQIGTGSYISSISRIRDVYLDRQIRNELENFGKWEFLAKLYDNLRAIFPEVDGLTGGLETEVAQFWTYWQALSDAVKAGDAAAELQAKKDIYASGDRIAVYLSSKARSLTNIRIELNTELRKSVDDTNILIKEIYELNRQIANVTGRGQHANDLMDQRTRALADLATLMNIDVGERTDGTVVIQLKGHLLVNGKDGYNEMTLVGGSKDSKFEEVALYEYGGGAKPVNIMDAIQNGKLSGIIEARDIHVHNYKVELDIFANSLITVVNKLHNQSEANMNFFVGNKATTMAINPGLSGGDNVGTTKYVPGDIAEIFANLDSKLMTNWVTSMPNVGFTSATPLGSDGILRINGIDIAYNAGDTIGTLAQKINAYPGTFSMIFDDTSHQVFMLVNDKVTIEGLDSTGTLPNPALLAFLNIRQEQISGAPVNYSESVSAEPVQSTGAKSPWVLQERELDVKLIPDRGTMLLYFEGIEYQINWTENEQVVITTVNTRRVDGLSGVPDLSIGTFDTNLQKFRFATDRFSGTNNNQILPFTLSDRFGNMTEVMKITESVRFGEAYTLMVNRLEGDIMSAKNIAGEYETSIEQLNALQRDITEVDPEEELAKAKAYQRAYDASVKLLAIIDQMLNMLINRTATPSSSWTD